MFKINRRTALGSTFAMASLASANGGLTSRGVVAGGLPVNDGASGLAAY